MKNEPVLLIDDQVYIDADVLLDSVFTVCDAMSVEAQKQTDNRDLANQVIGVVTLANKIEEAVKQFRANVTHN